MRNGDEFTNYLVVIKKLKPNSVRLVESRLNIINRSLKEIGGIYDQKTIETILARFKQKMKNNSLNSYIFSINTLVDFHLHRGSHLTLDKIRPFRKNKPIIHVLTSGEILKLWNTDRTYGEFRGKNSNRMNVVYKIFIQFLSLTGARFTEASLLKVSECNFEKLEIFFLEENTKGSEWRKAYLTPPLAQSMKNLITSEEKNHADYVFTNMTGHPLRPQEFSQELKFRGREAGITKKIYPHLFRHSFATHLAERGVELSKIASLLGHKDIQTTYDNYMHLADETLRKAVFNHELVSQYVPIMEKIDSFLKHINSFPFDQDPRFQLHLTQSPNEIKVVLKIK